MKRASALLLLTVAAFAASARADEPRESGPWDDVVFLPEKGLSVLLERDPRGVLLDRSTYVDLYRRARAARGTTGASAVSGPTLLRCDAQGTADGDRARVRLALSIAHSGQGRAPLPLRVGGAVLSASLDGKPATLGSDAKGTLLLAVEGGGLHEAVVEVAAPVTRVQGTRRVDLELPDAPASRWSLDIPGRATAAAEGVVFRTE